MATLNSKSQGFSLIEVLLVIALIALLLALGTSNWGHFAKTRAHKVAADNLISALQVAQSYAQNKNVQTYLVFAGASLPERSFRDFKIVEQKAFVAQERFNGQAVSENVSKETLIDWTSLPSGVSLKADQDVFNNPLFQASGVPIEGLDDLRDGFASIRFERLSGEAFPGESLDPLAITIEFEDRQNDSYPVKQKIRLQGSDIEQI